MKDKITQAFVTKFNEAQQLFLNGKYSESLKNYQILLKKNPKQVSVLNNMGLVYEKLGNFNDAIICYKECNEIIPTEKTIIHNLANAYCKVEKYSEAMPLLKEIITSDFRNESNHEKLALCLFYKQSKKETKDFIELAVKKFPNNSLLNELLGKTLLHLNSHKDGLKSLQKSTGFIEFNNTGVRYLL
jgi:tetratricopeptide (TPR) repeat protein